MGFYKHSMDMNLTIYSNRRKRKKLTLVTKNKKATNKTIIGKSSNKRYKANLLFWRNKVSSVGIRDGFSIRQDTLADVSDWDNYDD